MTTFACRVLPLAFAVSLILGPVWAQSPPDNAVVAPAPLQDATHSRSVRHTMRLDQPIDAPEQSEGPSHTIGPVLAGPVQSAGPLKSKGPVWSLGPYKSEGPNQLSGPIAAAGPSQ